MDVFGYYMGRNGEVVGAVVWCAWLLVLCFVQTGDGRSAFYISLRSLAVSDKCNIDYFHLTKRFGAIASSQLPFLYLLALKSPYSPLQILTRSSHETLNRLHQLLGRVLTVFFYVHAALYLNFYVVKNLLATKLQAAYIICGIVGIIAFTAVGTTALSPVRRWSYRVFYVTHVTLATILLPVLYFHVHHIRLFIYETVVIYALNTLLRFINTQTLPGTIRLIPDTNLLEIDVPLPKNASGKKQKLSTWQPGQHAYVSLAGHPMLRTFKSNPFTVASIPTVDGNLRFVAKVLDGNTAKLAQSANDRKRANTALRLSVEGPYGVATHADSLLQYDRVLLVAGGVGATFIVPLYRQLLADLSPSKGSYRRQKVRFLWAARSRLEVVWALPEAPTEREGFVERLNVCLTGSPSGAVLSSASEGFAVREGAKDDKAAYGEPEDGIELEEQKELLSSGLDSSAVANGHDGFPTTTGRPNLARIVDQTFAHSATEQVAIVVCGPKSLNQTLRKEVSRYVRRRREVWFWEESFAF